MILSKKQFDVLVYLESKRASMSQREIASATEMSLGTVNKVMAELADMSLVSEGIINEAGIEELEPYLQVLALVLYRLRSILPSRLCVLRGREL